MTDQTAPLTRSPCEPIDVHDLPPPDAFDAVIEAYKKDVDRTLLRENLKLTVQQRLDKMQSFLNSLGEWKEAGRKARARPVEDAGRP